LPNTGLWFNSSQRISINFRWRSALLL